MVFPAVIKIIVWFQILVFHLEQEKQLAFLGQMELEKLRFLKPF